MNGNDKHKWKWRLAIFALIATGIIGSLFARPSIAPDPAALKVQGADTLGNLVQVQAVQPGAGGTTQTPLSTSTNNANTAQNATINSAANQTAYVTGFQVTGSGATAASVINVTLVGIIGGSVNYTVVVPAGVTTSITPLIVTFPTPLPASAVNTNITLSVPAFGAGNTNQAASIQGFRQ